MAGSSGENSGNLGGRAGMGEILENSRNLAQRGWRDPVGKTPGIWEGGDSGIWVGMGELLANSWDLGRRAGMGEILENSRNLG